LALANPSIRVTNAKVLDVIFDEIPAMKSREAQKAATCEEWRELGFHIVFDERSGMWMIDGDRSGLSSFVDLLRSYASDPRNALLSEHEHYGPYMSFKITTAESARVDSTSIYGTINDITRLALLVEANLMHSTVGDNLIIGSDYSSDSGLRFHVHEDGFDPSSLDPMLWADSGH
jgi:hypothetical protein